MVVAIEISVVVAVEINVVVAEINPWSQPTIVMMLICRKLKVFVAVVAADKL